MTQLSSDDVRHIAKLARLEVSDADVTRLSTQLTSIIDYVTMLQEVDTTGVPPTAQVTGLTSALRADEPRPIAVEPDALLSCSPLPIVDHQIETPSAIA
jgi:aspartyl-tRNA(Asn)/glutamyl-tRNA(Gln) amidotransferase subunit C